MVESHIVTDESEVYAGIDECEALKLAEYVPEFHRVFFQEFAARRRVEKQVFHHKVAAGSCYYGFLAYEFGF